MVGIFWDATSFNQPLNGWDVSSVTNTFAMFRGADTFNQPLDIWNIYSVANMNGMSFNAISFNQPLESWDVSSVTNMTGMFTNAPHSTRIWWLVRHYRQRVHRQGGCPRYGRDHICPEPLSGWA